MFFVCGKAKAQKPEPARLVSKATLSFAWVFAVFTYRSPSDERRLAQQACFWRSRRSYIQASYRQKQVAMQDLYPRKRDAPSLDNDKHLLFGSCVGVEIVREPPAMWLAVKYATVREGGGEGACQVGKWVARQHESARHRPGCSRPGVAPDKVRIQRRATPPLALRPQLEDREVQVRSVG